MRVTARSFSRFLRSRSGSGFVGAASGRSEILSILAHYFASRRAFEPTATKTKEKVYTFRDIRESRPASNFLGARRAPFRPGSLFLDRLYFANDKCCFKKMADLLAASTIATARASESFKLPNYFLFVEIIQMAGRKVSNEESNRRRPPGLDKPTKNLREFQKTKTKSVEKYIFKIFTV